jgi:hydroxymethylbilane synthase
MTTRKLVVATRKSALALAQTRAFVAALIAKNEGLVVEELQVVTAGDRIQDRPLAEVGGKGLFVKEIEEALLDRRADFAIHSMKDLPAQLPAGLSIGCVPERADPRDVLLVREGSPTIEALPRGANVGSSSQRRRIALLANRGDLQVHSLRGNVDTRIRKLLAGEHDAIVLAAAGLARLGLDASTLPPHAPIAVAQMLPAVAQGILAIESRDDDHEVARVLATMEHAPSRLRALAERGVLEALGADCTVPLAAYATLAEGSVRIEAWLANPTGSARVVDAIDGEARSNVQARALGFTLGERLCDRLAALV